MDSEQYQTKPDRGTVSSQISREIVRLHAKMYGRGPTKAKTFLHDDFVLCLLEDVFTPAERTLVRAGNAEQVHSTRAAFQEAVGDDFIAVVEAATGRRVRAFMSQVHVDPEVAGELFLLEPLDTTYDAAFDGDGRRDGGAPETEEPGDSSVPGSDSH
jgi:uncharacterized protein YbcI